jgi:hypothetical protein
MAPSSERLGLGHVLPLVLLALVVVLAVSHEKSRAVPAAQPDTTEPGLPSAADLSEIARCKVPDFAKAMGHEAKWKLHNNCR